MGVLSGLWLAWLALIMLVSTLAHQNQNPPYLTMLLPQTDCPAPCWQGIRPVMLGREEKEAQIRGLPGALQQELYVWEFTPQVGYTHQVLLLNGITLVPDKVRLGEWLLAMGAPDYQTLQHAEHATSGEKVMLVRLYYQREQVLVVVAVPLGGRLAVGLPIVAINYHEEYQAALFYSYAWYGLIWLDAFPSIVE